MTEPTKKAKKHIPPTRISANCRIYRHKNGSTIKHWGQPAISPGRHIRLETPASLAQIVQEQKNAAYASLMRNREAQ
jgi:hypothetical protein